ncbi:MAG: ribosome biogenesis GTPase YlqF [Bacilli bacterium]|nr:ribosome biogenesis GTPase YlqF [Bacilli bacterium]
MNNQDNEKVFQKSQINWYPGHMAKTKRQIKEKIDLIDIVFEIIDARIPYTSKNKEVDDIIRNKPRVLIMTKRDLCDEEVSLKWKNYYEDKGYKVVMLDLIKDKSLDSLLNITKDMADAINKKRQDKGMKPRRIRVLILGIPNVGKSTLINRLVGRKATNVGNKPGITKSLEWIRINKDLELLDTPGILWPKLDNNEIALNLASMTAIKEEILNKEEVCIHIINKMIKLYPDSFKERYKLDNLDIDIVEILDIIGKNIGAIRNKETDYEKVYTVILKDLREGYLGRVTFDEYEDR